jgi:hypothetical protein
MSERAFWNRQGRRAGGYRKTKIHVAHVSKEELEIAKQVESIRREFGEAGVKRYWLEMKRLIDAEPKYTGGREP